MMKYISVAIDGPSGAGKSTVARAAAAKLGYVYVDTGAMYRSIGLAVCRRGIAGENTAGIIATLPEITIQLTYQDGAQHVLLNGEDVSEAIRTPEISYYASKVSAVPEVRRFLLETQRNMAKNGNILMDGRDIGTVILPDAPVKIFLTASAQSRAERRYKELIEKGQQVTMDGILHDINERDRQDMTRAVAPLKQADDAVLLDTSSLTLEESIAAFLWLPRDRTRKHPGGRLRCLSEPCAAVRPAVCGGRTRRQDAAAPDGEKRAVPEEDIRVADRGARRLSDRP